MVECWLLLVCLCSLLPSSSPSSCNPLLTRCSTSDAIDTPFVRDILPHHLDPPANQKERAVMEALTQVDNHSSHTQPSLLRQSTSVDSLRVASRLFASLFEWDDESRKRFFVAVVAEEATNKLRGREGTDSRGTVLEKMCPLRESEDCPSTKYRSADGKCNNVRHTEWGAAYSALQRHLPALYPNSEPGAPTHPHLPSSRIVSTSLFNNPSEDTEVSLTRLVPHFAHFVYSDLVQLAKPRITLEGKEYPIPCCDPHMKHPECTPIAVPANDTRFAGFISCLPYSRTVSAPNRACSFGERQQANLATSFLDGSIIYGSEPSRVRRLRAQTGGLLMTSYSSSPDFALPLEAPVSDCADSARACFVGGSNQVNFLPSSSALHTVWLRQHNRIAKELHRLNPHWQDMQLYQETKRIVVAQMQHVTYNEFLPIIMGREGWVENKLRGEATGFSSGYSTSIDPSVLNSFAAVAGQFFYTMMSSRMAHLDAHNNKLIERPLSELYNDPSSLFMTENISGILRHLVHTRTHRAGLHMNEELRDKLFKSISNLGLDMAALIVETGRDHGIPSYTAWRERCGFGKIATFGQLQTEFSGGMRVTQEMQKIYRNVEDVDLIVGGLAEKPVRGGLVGRTLHCIIGIQLHKTKFGDRFWYENEMAPSQFTHKQLMEIRKSTMARILCENGRIQEIQPRAFEIEDDFDNSALPCSMLKTPNLDQWRDTSQLLEVPVSMLSVRKALELGKKEVEERRKRETHNIKKNQGEFKDGDPLLSYGKMMRAKREAIELSKISSILLASSHALLDEQQSLIGKDGLPLRLDRNTLQTIMPQIDVSEFVGNFTALLGKGGSVNKCLPKPLPCDHTSLYRTYSGWCNNLLNPHFGNAFGPLRHLLKPAYEDGMDAPRSRARSGRPLPNPRLISNAVHLDLPYHHKKYTLMIMQFGQILDHEVTHSPVERGPHDEILNCTRCDSPSTLSIHCMPLEVPEGDAHFPTHFDGERRCLPFARSLLGQLTLGYRNQLNQLSSYLDGSVIYGSTKCEADSLRLFRDGKMNFTNLGHHNEMALPQGLQEQDCRSTPKYMCFVAGDERNSHQPALTVMHNIFLREHNRIAAELTRLNPQWDDERLFQETRRIVSAEFNHITFNEYLPKLIGSRLVEKYGLTPKTEGYFQGYNDSCDASISQPFATAAFRFGHTLIRRMFPRMDSSFHNMSAPVDLADHFNNVEPLYNSTAGGMDSLLMGLLGTPSMAFDRHITDAVRNHLFGRRGHPTSGMDLITINILRARDHGVQPYNDFRALCGVGRARSWGDLSPSMEDASIQALTTVYESVDDIDLFPGLLSEIPIKGALMPPTMACLIAEQFERLKKCDRFHYENDIPNTKFSLEQLAEIRKVTLGTILCANSKSMARLQPDVFIMPDQLTNSQVPCRDFATLDLKPWIDRPTCYIEERHVPRGQSTRKSPCISCTCTSDGPRCRSLVVGSCKQLLLDFSIQEIKKDMSCVIQCASLIRQHSTDF